MGRGAARRRPADGGERADDAASGADPADGRDRRHRLAARDVGGAGDLPGWSAVVVGAALVAWRAAGVSGRGGRAAGPVAGRRHLVGRARCAASTGWRRARSAWRWRCRPSAGARGSCCWWSPGWCGPRPGCCRRCSCSRATAGRGRRRSPGASRRPALWAVFDGLLLDDPLLAFHRTDALAGIAAPGPGLVGVVELIVSAAGIGVFVAWLGAWRLWACRRSARAGARRRAGRAPGGARRRLPGARALRAAAGARGGGRRRLAGAAARSPSDRRAGGARGAWRSSSPPATTSPTAACR